MIGGSTAGVALKVLIIIGVDPRDVLVVAELEELQLEELEVDEQRAEVFELPSEPSFDRREEEGDDS